MRVIVNRQATVGLRTGVGHYTAELLRCLPRRDGRDRIDAWPHGLLWLAYRAWVQSRPGLGGRAGDGSQTAGPARGTSPSLCGRALGSLRRFGKDLLAWHNRACFTRRAYDLYHEPNFIPFPCDVPTVVTIHDLSALLHPEWHPADRVALHERRFRDGLAQCVHFLTVSEFTRQEVIRNLGIAPAQVTRVYNGVRAHFRPLPRAEVDRVLRRLGLPPQYLLYLGTLEPRKNVLLLLRAYCGLPASLRQRYPLLLVGGWGWNAGELAAYLHDQARHKGVLHLGYVAEPHVPALYNGARALAYPSLYEGFGLPPLEMLACGGAVLASTAGAVAETAGAKAQLLDPHDLDGWRQALARVLADDDWHAELRQGAVEAARPFTWQRCAADTLRVYRAMCGEVRPLAA